LLIRHLDAAPTEEHALVPTGRFADIASPHFSPNRDEIAFVVVVPMLGRGNLISTLFGPSIAHAHGLPWDVWVVGSDGSGLRQLAALGGDDPSVAWSPDGSQLFVYGGTGSFIVDVTTGDVAEFPYLAGYGGAAWTSAWPT
jgi:Tol biopolymer transport system component